MDYVTKLKSLVQLTGAFDPLYSEVNLRFIYKGIRNCKQVRHFLLDFTRQYQ